MAPRSDRFFRVAMMYGARGEVCLYRQETGEKLPESAGIAMKGLIIASGIVGLLIGAGFGNWVSDLWGDRYQALALRNSVLVRLNTKTGEMKVFVPAEDVSREDAALLQYVGISRSFERLVSSDEMKVVTDLAAVERCIDLGYFGVNENTEKAANRGGDTLYRGKDRAGEERVWLYRCNPN
jgi:hypothetical protein